MERSPLPERIGFVLKRRREAQNLSQERVAEDADMEPTYYPVVERGLKNMRVETLYRICVALRMRMWEVFKEADTILVVPGTDPAPRARGRRRRRKRG